MEEGKTRAGETAPILKGTSSVATVMAPKQEGVKTRTTTNLEHHKKKKLCYPPSPKEARERGREQREYHCLSDKADC